MRRLYVSQHSGTQYPKHFWVLLSANLAAGLYSLGWKCGCGRGSQHCCSCVCLLVELFDCPPSTLCGLLCCERGATWRCLVSYDCRQSCSVGRVFAICCSDGTRSMSGKRTHRCTYLWSLSCPLVSGTSVCARHTFSIAIKKTLSARSIRLQPFSLQLVHLSAYRFDLTERMFVGSLLRGTLTYEACSHTPLRSCHCLRCSPDSRW